MRQLLVCVMALAGCGVDSSRNLTPVVEDGTDLADWTGDVQSAVSSWQRAIGADCTFPIGVGPGGAPVILTAEPIPGARARTFTGADQRDVLEIRVFDQGDLHGVLVHELGHAIGLGHETSLGSVMHAPSVAQDPDDNDALRARHAIGC